MQYVSPEILKTVEDHISKNYCNSSGIDCVFYKFEGFGIKLYYRDFIRDHSYKWQKLASIFGLGPKCWNRFEGKCLGGHRHGFFTELAIPTNKTPNYDEEFNDFRHISAKKNLAAALKTLNIRISDFHDANWGYIGERPVAIDFGSPGHALWYKDVLQ